MITAYEGGEGDTDVSKTQQIFNCSHQHGPFTQPSFSGKYNVLVQQSLMSLNLIAEGCSF